MSIHAVLEGLLTRAQHDNAELLCAHADAPAIQSAAEALRKGDPEAFQHALSRPLEQLVDGLLSRELPKAYRLQFLCKHVAFVERHFKGLISRYEGPACSADKSRSIVRALFKSLQTNQPIVWDYAQKYTYHLPNRVFKTHATIEAFFDGLHSLYYGNPNPYLEALKRVVEDGQHASATNESATHSDQEEIPQ